MLKYIGTIIVFLFVSLLYGTMVQEKKLGDLLPDADHIFIGHVIKVDMVDRKGHLITDNKARTGPGLKNTIRLHVKVKKVLHTTSKETPDIIIIKLWDMWHYSLGQIKRAAKNERAIYLLKGPNYEIVFPRHFTRPLHEKKAIIEYIDKKKSVK